MLGVWCTPDEVAWHQSAREVDTALPGTQATEQRHERAFAEQRVVMTVASLMLRLDHARTLETDALGAKVTRLLLAAAWPG